MTIVTSAAMERTLHKLLADLMALSGDTMPPAEFANVGWQNIARDAANQASKLGLLLGLAANGHHESCISFPSPAEILGTIEEFNGPKPTETETQH